MATKTPQAPLTQGSRVKTREDTPLPPATVRHEPCRLTGGGSVPAGGVDLVAEGFGRQYLSAEVWSRLGALEAQPHVSFPVLARALLRWSQINRGGAAGVHAVDVVENEGSGGMFR